MGGLVTGFTGARTPMSVAWNSFTVKVLGLKSFENCIWTKFIVTWINRVWLFNCLCCSKKCKQIVDFIFDCRGTSIRWDCMDCQGRHRKWKDQRMYKHWTHRWSHQVSTAVRAIKWYIGLTKIWNWWSHCTDKPGWKLPKLEKYMWVYLKRGY